MNPEDHDPLPKTTVIIPAAGDSTRMGGDTRKPWLQLAGRSILARTCERVKEMPGVAELILVLHREDVSRAQNECWEELQRVGVDLVVAGGATRTESVWNGVQVADAESDLVAIHDAVRPFVLREVCELLFRTAELRGAAVPIVPMSDTVKRTEGDLVTETVRRRGLVRVQTPQVFQRELFIQANEYALSTGGFSDAITDDASLVEAYGREVAVVLSHEANFKITTPRDLRLAEALIAAGMDDA